MAILGLLCGLLNIIVLTSLFQNNWENKKDCFNGENVIYLTCYQLSRFVLAFLVVFRYKYEYYIEALIYTLFFGYSW